MFKLTIKTLERRHCRLSGIFIVKFEHISHLILVFLLLTLSRWVIETIKTKLNFIIRQKKLIYLSNTGI